TSRIPHMSRVPGPLCALVAITIVQALFNFDGVATIGSTFGEIPRGLPSFAWPDITLTRLVELIGPAFAIAMLGAIESLLSAVVADGMTATRHNSNQELVGQGLANVLAPLFGGIAATGAIARTATNIRNGGNSPIAGIVHAVVLVLVLLFLAPLAGNIPLATLAAILFVVAWNMSNLRHVVRMFRQAPRADVVILLVTFCLTVFADLVVAVNIGVVLAMLHFLRRMSESVVVRRQDDRSLQHELAHQGIAELPPGVLVYTIEGPFFFAAADAFQKVLAETHTDPKVLLIRLGHVPFIDATGLEALEDAVMTLQGRGIRVILVEANERVRAKLQKMGLISKLGSANFSPSLAEALARL